MTIIRVHKMYFVYFVYFVEPNVDIVATPITNIIILTPHLHCKSVISYNLGQFYLSTRLAASSQGGGRLETETVLSQLNLLLPKLIYLRVNPAPVRHRGHRTTKLKEKSRRRKLV